MGFHPCSEPLGVPCGSYLGLIFYKLYESVTSKIHPVISFLLHADVLKLFKYVKSLSDSVIYQENINRIYNWYNTNSILLKPVKFSLVTHTNLTKLIIDSKLLFSTFITLVIRFCKNLYLTIFPSLHTFPVQSPV